jgi:methionyl-tRNA formyltransferase
MKSQETRVAFMGTPDFSVHILEALLKANYNVVAVYTQPPRPVGRGYKITPSPVHAFAEAHGIAVYTPKTLKTEEEQQTWRNLKLDIAIVAAYGLILPKPILETPKKGCVNIHTSLLPRWRGAAPIQRAILEGDRETGITLIKMDEGLDTGDIIIQERIELSTRITTPKLQEDLIELANKLLLKSLPDYLENKLKITPQPRDGVTYAIKLDKSEGQLDWNLPAEVLDRKVRALNPWPGTWFSVGEDRIKVLDAEVISLSSPESPGKILDSHLTIACGNNALRLLRVQKIGKSPLPADEFLRGYEFPSQDLMNAAV